MRLLFCLLWSVSLTLLSQFTALNWLVWDRFSLHWLGGLGCLLSLFAVYCKEHSRTKENGQYKYSH